jgi:glycerophosphoryl diester phosphodiesterase
MKQKLKKHLSKLKQPRKLSFWDNNGLILAAHRGGDGAGKEKENTLAAFQAAREAGYKYGETDVILSKDGQVVAIHGAANLWDSILRKRHSRRRLQRLSLEKMRKKWTIGGEQIPTLEEILMAQKKMRFFIDPKTEEVVEPLYKLLKRLNALDRVCVGSFNYHRVQRFRQLAGTRQVHTSFIIGRAFRLINKNKNQLMAANVKNVDAVKLHHSLVSQPMIDLVHKQGFKAVVWTANSEISIKNAVKCGVDGIVSDRIHLLREVINNQKV